MIESYYNDILYLYGTKDNYVALDDCTQNNNKILTCKILTEKLEEIITVNDEHLLVGAINDNFGIYNIYSILPIRIQSNYIKKTDVYLSFKELFSLNSEIGVPFGFKTNVTNIPNLITKKFNDF